MMIFLLLLVVASGVRRRRRRRARKNKTLETHASVPLTSQLVSQQNHRLIAHLRPALFLFFSMMPTQMTKTRVKRDHHAKGLNRTTTSRGEKKLRNDFDDDDLERTTLQRDHH